MLRVHSKKDSKKSQKEAKKMNSQRITTKPVYSILEEEEELFHFIKYPTGLCYGST